jgi:hypothetical protein
MSNEPYHNAFEETKERITVNGRTYVAKRKFVWFRRSQQSEGFERNEAGEILYALPGTDATATEAELREGC